MCWSEGMNKIKKGLAALGLLIVAASQSQAALITNGNFAESCELSSWNQDTDGEGDQNNVVDFYISDSGSNCTANVSVGDWDYSPTIIANTFWQELDLTGANDSTFLLSMDFSVDSVLTSIDEDYIGDYLYIALGDGTGVYFDEDSQSGSLFEMVIDGYSSFVFDFNLASSFANQTGWSLEFQMLDDWDGFGSTLSINNVSLTEVLAPSVDVPEPTSFSLFALGFAGLFTRRKLANELIRKSLNK